MKKGLLSLLASLAIIAGCTTNVEALPMDNTTFATPVAAQLGGYLVQLNSYDQAFQNMDMYMLSPQKVRRSKLSKKMHGEAGNNEFETSDVNDSNAIWARMYGTLEHVNLHNGPNATNNLYGAYFGGESEMKELGDWDAKWGVYTGYNGAHQAIFGNKILENGGTFGLVGMAYKNDFFIGGTVNVGATAGSAEIEHSVYHHDDFAMLMTGAAVKTGYNWELADGKFIIQPALQASYSFVNTFDQVSGSGTKMDSNPLNAVQIEPQIKFIGNLKNGWQPYIGVSFVYSILDKTHFSSGNIKMPSFSVNPYVKYGFGARKIWGERISGFAQMFFMNGGRSGLGAMGGLRFTLGKAGSNGISTSASDPKMEKAKISLNYKK